MPDTVTAVDFGTELVENLLNSRADNEVLRPDRLNRQLFMNRLASSTFFHDDFWELRTTMWGVASDTGPADLAVLSAGLAGGQGVLSSALGTTADRGTVLVGQNGFGPCIGFRGTYEPGIAVRFQISDQADQFQAEIGFVDADTTDTNECVTGIDTPTIANGADDAAFMAIDTDETDTSWNLVTGHATNGDAAQDTAQAQENDKWFTVGVQIDSSGNVWGMFWDENNVLQSRVVSLVSAAGITPTVNLKPRIFFQQLDTTDYTVYVDWVAIWANRA